MKRCQRCVLPDTIPGITFDRNNICSFCLDYENENRIKEQEIQEMIIKEYDLDPAIVRDHSFRKYGLERVINEARAKKRQYDCLVGISGGRDSLFVLYTAKKKFGLNVLAFNWDNGFQSDQAIENMKNACDILNVDFLSVPSRKSLFKKVVSYGVKTSLSGGPYSVLKGLCTDCTWCGAAAAMKYAKLYQIPLILYGQSNAEATQRVENMALSHFNPNSFRKRLNVNWYLQVIHRLLLRFEFHMPGNKLFIKSFPSSPEIRKAFLFYHIPWNREKIKETLSKELNWKKPANSVSSWRFDCHIHSLVNSLYVRLLGCTKDSFGYCNMINEGNMTRKQALEQEEQLVRQSFSPRVREILTANMQLGRNDIDEFMKLQTY